MSIDQFVMSLSEEQLMFLRDVLPMHAETNVGATYFLYLIRAIEAEYTERNG